MKLLLMYFSPLRCHLIPLCPTYHPQHPIREHPQPMFLRQWARPSFTPMHNRHNYSSVYMYNYSRQNKFFNPFSNARTCLGVTTTSSVTHITSRCAEGQMSASGVPIVTSHSAVCCYRRSVRTSMSNFRSIYSFHRSGLPEPKRRDLLEKRRSRLQKILLPHADRSPSDTKSHLSVCCK
jgi:hypothetical protein